MRRVLVTVELGDGGSARDLEIPADVPAERLAAVLAAALVPEERRAPGAYRLRVLPLGRVLSPEETLASAGLWDGSRLVLGREDEDTGNGGAGSAAVADGGVAGGGSDPPVPAHGVPGSADEPLWPDFGRLDGHLRPPAGETAAASPPAAAAGVASTRAPAREPLRPRSRRGWVVAVLGRPGVGRTTATAGLASALGAAGASVAAVDAARPQPRLGYLLGAWQTSGYREALQGIPLDWCLAATPHPGVALLPSGVAAVSAGPPPAPGAVAELLNLLAARYEWVTVDLPGDPAAPEVAGAVEEADLALWVVDGDPLDLTLIRERWSRQSRAVRQAVVVNRWHPGTGVTAEWVAEYLHLPVLAEIPEERSAARPVVLGGSLGDHPPGGRDGWGLLARAVLSLRQDEPGPAGPVRFR